MPGGTGPARSRSRPTALGPLRHHRLERRRQTVVGDGGVGALQVPSVIATISTLRLGAQAGAPAEILVVGQQLEPLEPAERAQAEDREEHERARSPAPSAAVARRPPDRGGAALAAWNVTASCR